MFCKNPNPDKPFFHSFSLFLSVFLSSHGELANAEEQGSQDAFLLQILEKYTQGEHMYFSLLFFKIFIVMYMFSFFFI